MIRTSYLRSIAALSLMAASLGACGSDDIVAPREPGIHVLTEPRSDTIEAVLPTAFAVEVRDTDGQPMRGAEVHFHAPTSFVPELMGYANAVMVARDIGSQPCFETLVTDTTDAQGRASVRVRLGARAPTGRLFIKVGDFLHP